VETHAQDALFRRGSVVATLWFAVLAGPTAWMLGLNADYAIVRWSCATYAMWPLHLVTAVTLLLAIAGGAVGWRQWQRAGAHPPGEAATPLERSRFMAALALLASPLFALVILAQWAAKLFFNPCMGI